MPSYAMSVVVLAPRPYHAACQCAHISRDMHMRGIHVWIEKRAAHRRVSSASLGAGPMRWHQWQRGWMPAAHMDGTLQ